MPKTFSVHEREAILASMHKIGIDLIRKKGIKQVTVEDITKGVNIAKGSFYSFYNSKEELFWDIIKQEEKHLVESIIAILSQDIDLKTKIQKMFYEEYLKKDSIVFYLPQIDFEYLTRKLPSAIVQLNEETGADIYKTILSLCGLDTSPESIEILESLTATVQFMASSDIPRSDATRKKILDILIGATSEYLIGEQINKTTFN